MLLEKVKLEQPNEELGRVTKDKVGRRAIRVMDLRSEKNLDLRLENVLSHHNAIRKGLKRKFIKKKTLKKNYLKSLQKF